MRDTKRENDKEKRGERKREGGIERRRDEERLREGCIKA